MGFLKFLKKKEKGILDLSMKNDLDMPPVPPPLKEKEPMPRFDLEDKDISFPEIRPEFKEDVKPEIKEEIPPFMREQLPKPEQTSITPPEIKIPVEKPITPYEREERRAVREEEKILRHRAEHLEPIYLRIDKFKIALNNISIIRNDLKKADNALIKLSEIKTEEDKEFEKWYNVVGDIQKKLIFVDKTIFKGEAEWKQIKSEKLPYL